MRCRFFVRVVQFGDFVFEFFPATGADAVGEVRVGVRMNVLLDRLPVALVVADTFAPGANRDEAGQGFDLGQRLLEFADEFLAFDFHAVTARQE